MDSVIPARITSLSEFQRYNRLQAIMSTSRSSDVRSYMLESGFQNLPSFATDKHEMRNLSWAIGDRIRDYLSEFKPPNYPDNWTLGYIPMLIESLEAGRPMTLKLSILISDAQLPDLFSGKQFIFAIERAFDLPQTGNKDKMFYNYKRRYHTAHSKTLFLPHRRVELAARSGYVDVVDNLLATASKRKDYDEYLTAKSLARGAISDGHLELTKRALANPLTHRCTEAHELAIWAVQSGSLEVIEHVISTTIQPSDSYDLEFVFETAILKGSSTIFNLVYRLSDIKNPDRILGITHVKSMLYTAAGRSGCPEMIEFLDSMYGKSLSTDLYSSDREHGRILYGIPDNKESCEDVDLEILIRNGLDALFHYYFERSYNHDMDYLVCEAIDADNPELIKSIFELEDVLDRLDLEACIEYSSSHGTIAIMELLSSYNQD